MEQSVQPHIYIVRHGAYDPTTGHLTDRGREELYQQGLYIRTQAKQQQFHLDDIQIYSSHAYRAYESASCLAAALFGAPTHEHAGYTLVPELFSEPGVVLDEPKIIDTYINPYLQTRKILIFVTHFEYSVSLTREIAYRVLHTDMSDILRPLERGDMWRLIPETKQTMYISRFQHARG